MLVAACASCLGINVGYHVALIDKKATRSDSHANHRAAVVEAFCRLHGDGLVHRGQRMVHWCPQLRTVLSDIEVEHEELGGPTQLQLPGQKDPVEFGVLHSFAYPLPQGGELVVSTTRLETMLGDVAIAVHPDDSRYAHLIGRELVRGLL
eukprot:SAG31_NODE_276_length_18650_cov_5.821842_23_plen_150_part_00